jgi:hypothetical protein
MKKLLMKLFVPLGICGIIVYLCGLSYLLHGMPPWSDNLGGFWFAHPPEKVQASDSLEVRGRKLLNALEWTYNQKYSVLVAKHPLGKTHWDVTSVVAPYIYKGMPISDAMKILKSAGFDGVSVSSGVIAASIDAFRGGDLDTCFMETCIVSVDVKITTEFGKKNIPATQKIFKMNAYLSSYFEELYL